MNVALSHLPLYIAPLLLAIAAIIGAVTSLLGPHDEPAYPRATKRARVARVALVVGSLGALVVLAIAATQLFKVPTTLTIGPRVARIGSFDATLSYVLTPTGFVVAALALVSGVAFGLGSPRGAKAAEFAAAACVICGSVQAALAEGFPTFIEAWGLIVVGAAAIVGRRSAGAARVVAGGLASAVGVALAAGVIFWALGGQFLDGRKYLADYRPRFQTQVISPGQEFSGTSLDVRPQGAELSMLTSPGARVYLGVANDVQLTPRLAPDAIAPFERLPVAASVQKIAIDLGGGAMIGGDGYDVALVDQVRFLSGSHLAISLVGPTLSFREIADQIAMPASATAPAFDKRMLASIAAPDWALALLLLAFAGLAVSLARGVEKPSGRAIAAVGFVALAASGSEKLGPALRGGGAIATVGAALLAAFAVWNALVATRSRTFGGIAARIVSATVALGGAGVVANATAAPGLLACVPVGLVALSLAVDGLADPLRNGADATVVGASRPAILATIVGAFGASAAIGSGGIAKGGVVGIAVAVAALGYAAAITYTLTRASGFMSVVELERVEPMKKASKKKKRAEQDAKDDKSLLVAKKVDAPSEPVPARAIALAAALALGGAIGAIALSRGLGAATTTVAQGLTVGAIAAAAFVAFVRARGAGENPKPRAAWLAEDNVLSRAANAEDAATDGKLLRTLGAIERALLLPFEGPRLAASEAGREADAGSRSEGRAVRHDEAARDADGAEPARGDDASDEAAADSVPPEDR